MQLYKLTPEEITAIEACNGNNVYMIPCNYPDLDMPCIVVADLEVAAFAPHKAALGTLNSERIVEYTPVDPFEVAFDLVGAQNKKTQELNVWYNDRLEENVTVTVGETNYTLLSIPDAQMTVTQGLVILNTALLQATDPLQFLAANLSDVVGRKLWLADGTQVDVTVAVYMQICVDYAAAIGAIQNQRNLYLMDISTAKTQADLDAIVFSCNVGVTDEVINIATSISEIEVAVD